MESFKRESANINNPKWENMIKREKELYQRPNSLRTEYGRDYTRILHSNGYKRMKHKTQVFFSPKNDHICTRIEHVNLVESISYTIADNLGLNLELTKAIATSHDIGHSPFGHQGEQVLSRISKRDLNKSFWHEKNSVNMADNIELLEDLDGNKQNLNLTYAVRDGMISHCGEIDENIIKPRQEYIDLKDYTKPNEYAPYTWEGCVVKVSDKISYVGRDIEDALKLNILTKQDIKELDELLTKEGIKEKGQTVNNTNIINDLIVDLCYNSSIEKGLCFSKEKFDFLNKIKEFNYKKIYLSDRMSPSLKYFDLVINTIYDALLSLYNDNEKQIDYSEKIKFYPFVVSEFLEWIDDYILQEDDTRLEKKLNNKVVYDLRKKEDYMQAIIDYISGMTDNYAIKTYQDIISF